MARRKKLLVTGFTATHVGSMRRAPKTKYVSAPIAVVNAANALGMEVTQRSVIPGEDLRGYDRVVVFVSGMLQLNSLHAPGALWTLSQRPDAMAWVDDWQTGVVGSQLKTCAYKPRYAWDACMAATSRPRTQREISAKLRKVIDAQMVELYERPPTFVCPMFGWGDADKLEFKLGAKPKTKSYDPSGLFYEDIKRVADGPPTFRPNGRECAWVLATLGDHSKWLAEQNLSWPVVTFGHKNIAEKPVLESEVIANYKRHIGLLSPNYVSAKAGWWRVRWNHAAVTETIVGCSPDEAPSSLFDAYTLNDIEGMTMSQLKKFAVEQSDWIFEFTSCEDEALQQIKQLLR